MAPCKTYSRRHAIYHNFFFFFFVFFFSEKISCGIYQPDDSHEMSSPNLSENKNQNVVGRGCDWSLKGLTFHFYCPHKQSFLHSE